MTCISSDILGILVVILAISIDKLGISKTCDLETA